jgi:2,3,4,5-tetrahydropyridine-2-carboxylate N-succinyltransferase
MVDTWATGSCAQIGKTYIYGGVGIGGVLEPLQAAPALLKMALYWFTLYRS